MSTVSNGYSKNDVVMDVDTAMTTVLIDREGAISQNDYSLQHSPQSYGIDEQTWDNYAGSISGVLVTEYEYSAAIFNQGEAIDLHADPLDDTQTILVARILVDAAMRRVLIDRKGVISQNDYCLKHSPQSYGIDEETWDNCASSVSDVLVTEYGYAAAVFKLEQAIDLHTKPLDNTQEALVTRIVS